MTIFLFTFFFLFYNFNLFLALSSCVRVRAPKVHVKWPTEAHKEDTGDNQPQKAATGCKFMMCQNILRAKAAAALFLFVPGLSFAERC